jgi:3-methyladenine DNA glycosylase AlkD
MTLKQAMDKLESLGNPTMRAHNVKCGAGENQFGVKRGDIRKLAGTIKTDHELALALWQTGNSDAQLLAALILKPTLLSADQIDRMVRSITFAQVADWFISNVVAPHPEVESLRQRWIAADHPMTARAGWSLTADKIAKSPDALDPTALLNRIESEMPNAAPETQWTMNMTLGQIGIHIPKLRKRAIAIGEKLGLYRDYPVSKGCTSPFAPTWINAIVARQKR